MGVDSLCATSAAAMIPYVKGKGKNSSKTKIEESKGKSSGENKITARWEAKSNGSDKGSAKCNSIGNHSNKCNSSGKNNNKSTCENKDSSFDDEQELVVLQCMACSDRKALCYRCAERVSCCTHCRSDVGFHFVAEGFAATRQMIASSSSVRAVSCCRCPFCPFKWQ